MNVSIRTLALGTVLLASAAAAQDRGGEVPGLLMTLKSEKPGERAGSARTIGEIGPAAGALTAALKDADWQVRRAAARSLGRLGTRDVESALKAAKNDAQEAVRNAAKASLEQIKKLPKPQKMKTMK